jgi:uncharacterized protein
LGVAAELSAADWAALATAALLVGFAKTAIGGVAAISVAVFAAVLPARESTGALLLLLIVGDLFAMQAYRQHADWSALRELFPAVAAGVGVGVVFLALVGDRGVQRTIGALLLMLVGVHLWQRSRSHAGLEYGNRRRSRRTRIGLALGFGILAGFTTMVANAGGPVMAVYLLTAGVGMLGFLGTSAWFFFVVNLFKLPFSVGLGLITSDTLRMVALLVPAVLVGAALGRLAIRRLDDRRFEALVLLFTVLASLNLLR